MIVYDKHTRSKKMPLPKSQMDPMISSIDSNEYINSITHLLGTILALNGLTILIVLSALESKTIHVISFSIYGATLFLSFLSSTLLHFFLLFNQYRRVLGILDHSAIYLLIAGTYTPIALIVLGGKLGWFLFALVWSIAILFITLKAIFFKTLSKHLSNFSYILMGWIAMFFIYKIYLTLGIVAMGLMLTGGLFYTLGSIMFYLGKPNPNPPFLGNHEIWHICVLLGNGSFFFLMLYFVLPLSI